MSKFARTGAEEVHQAIARSLSGLGVDSLDGYLLHRFEDYRRDPKIWDDLKSAQGNGKIRKIGFSLYTEEELNYLRAKKLKFDLLQVPYSIFDQRFEKHFQQLHDEGVEIHTRSVFLQGLVFRKPEALDKYFDKVRAKISQLNELAAMSGRSVVDLCLSYVLSNKCLDRVVVGVDRLENLQEILAASQSLPLALDLRQRLSDLREDDEKIILPFNWGRP